MKSLRRLSPVAITKINKKVALYGGVAASVDKTSGDTEPLKVYHVRAKGANSKIPVPTSGFFRSRPGRTQITLVNGDVLTELTLTRICKTDANIAMSEATTEVQDDCMPVMSKVLVGTADLTGTFSRVLQIPGRQACRYQWGASESLVQ